MPQISTIKPVDVTKPKVKPQFTFNDDAYQSYIQEGFEVPTRAPGREGKIKVRLMTHYFTQIAVSSDWHVRLI